MGKPTGFMEYQRQVPAELPETQRIKNYKEFQIPLPVLQLQEQGARCMDCGIPMCHAGCPLANLIPDWNDRVYRGEWKQAIDFLHATNNFPEFTGRVCPAPCEEACVLGINEPPVTIKNIELFIIEEAFRRGYVHAQPPQTRTGKKVAVVGSGPAGLACADQLNRAGHHVIVFERADRIGGLLRYGIPDFKLEKSTIDRRLKLMQQEGIVFKTSVNVGFDIKAEELQKQHDAIVLCGGATKSRDLLVPGRELDGIHFAMEYLPQQNKRVAGDASAYQNHDENGWWFNNQTKDILARNKHVIVIGGGDTGSDCVGTANRQGSKTVTQFEIMPQPPEDRPAHQPWPYWPMKFRTSSSHREGCDRHFSIATKRFSGESGRVKAVETIDLEWVASNGSGAKMQERPGTERTWPADLVLLAMGFLGPETDGIVDQLAVELDERRNVRTDDNYMTSKPGVFACGDLRRGQSLIVWAISEGREAARSIDESLMGRTELPTKGEGDLPRV